MASLVKQGDTYGLIWTDSSREQSQTRESLKTSSKQLAKKRKAQLEADYYTVDENGQRKHDPWKRKWYERAETRGEKTLQPTVEEFIRFKSRSKGEKGWSESVASRETYVLRKFVRLTGKGRPLSSINEDDLEAFYYREGVTSDHTRNGDYISVNTFLNWATGKGYIESKPEYKPKKPQTKIPKFIYPEDLAQLIGWRLDKIKQDIDNGDLKRPERGAYWTVLGWMVLAGTGLRPIELANLTLGAVEERSLIIGEGFTTKVRAERRVPLLFESQQAVSILTDPRYRQKEASMRNSEYLLGRKPSYSKKQLSIEFTNAWEGCFPDKPKRTLYNLKDMFCVRFLSDESIPSPSGMKLNDLKEILGHSSLETTQKYLKALPFGTSVRGTIWDYPAY